MIHLPWRHLSLATSSMSDGPGIWTSLLMEEASKLAELASAGHVLEIGTACGFASVAMSPQALQITTVDLPQGWVSGQDQVEETFRAYDVTNVTRVLESSFTFLPKLASLGAVFDLIFIDGDHAEDSLRQDFQNSVKLIRRPGGVIAVHDYLEDCCLEVKPAMDAIIPEGPDYITGSMAVYEF